DAPHGLDARAVHALDAPSARRRTASELKCRSELGLLQLAVALRNLRMVRVLVRRRLLEHVGQAGGERGGDGHAELEPRRGESDEAVPRWYLRPDVLRGRGLHGVGLAQRGLELLAQALASRLERPPRGLAVVDGEAPCVLVEVLPGKQVLELDEGAEVLH